ncbi:MAG: hypothetical protein ACFE0P_01370 [Oceanicaulis sp.]
MTKLLLAAPAAGLFVCACVFTPDPADPSWTDARLRETPPDSAPAYVEETVLSQEERLELATAELRTIQARQRVRLTGVALRAPTVDTAEFVVEARARGLPPSQ